MSNQMKTITKICSVIALLLIIIVNIDAQEIFDAIRNGDVAKVKELVEKDPHLLNARNARQSTPLHVAVDVSNEPITRYLIEKEADLDTLNMDRRSPLTYSRNIEIAKLLIEKGANININTSNDGVLGWLLYLRRKEVAEYLLDVGAELPDIKSPRALNLLKNAITCGSLKCFDRFIQKGFDPYYESDAKSTLVHYAAEGNSTEIIKKLIAFGVQVNKTNIYGWTPLHTAAYKGTKEVADLLIQKGLDKNARSIDGSSPYNLAKEADNPEVANYLKAIGADQSAQKFPELSGEYLGQPKPGTKAVPFAPGIVSVQYSFHGSFSFAPDGNEACWSVQGVRDSIVTIMGSKRTNGLWTKPEPLYKNADVPFVSPDGSKFYFVSWDQATGQQRYEHEIKALANKPDGWSEPRALPEIINSNPGIYWGISVDGMGNLYFGARQNKTLISRIYCSRFIDGIYSEPKIFEKLKEVDAYSPYIAPDGSYLIITSSENSEDNLKILFKKKDGTWTKEKNISEMIGSHGMCPIVSHDGKYLFFIAPLDGKYSQYWVDASFIKDLREEDL